MDIHLLHFLDGNNNISVKPYFGGIVLVRGPGHMEKNQTQPFLSLLRTILFKLADKFVFIIYFVENIYPGRLQILHLMHLQKNWFIFFTKLWVWKLATINWKFWFNQRVINLNFNFCYNLIFKIFHGLKFYRTGIRHNNSQHAMARRQAIVPPMFIQNYLIYQIILLNDMKERLEAPKEDDDFIISKRIIFEIRRLI